MLNYAIFDIVLAFVGMGILSPLLSGIFWKFGIIIPKKNWLFFTLPIGIISHLLTGQNTLMTKNFMDMNSQYMLKILIIGSFIAGFWGIKKK